MSLSRKNVIIPGKRTKFSVSTTLLLHLPAEAKHKKPQYWTIVRQNTSVIASKTNCFFYCPVPLFSCPWEKLCWRSPGVPDHGEGAKERERQRVKKSANNSHPSPLPAMPLNAAISSFGQMNQDSLPSALNCILSLQCTTLHARTHMPNSGLLFYTTKYGPLCLAILKNKNGIGNFLLRYFCFS